MIELVSESRCISCDKCVKVDCQTCFLCEAYCPVDALFVAAEAHEDVQVDEATLIAQGLLGQYRRNLGWAKGSNPIEKLNELNELRERVGSPF